MIEQLPLLTFVGLLAIAAGSDVARMTIPNWVSLALTGLFPLAALASGFSLGAIGLHLAFGAGVLAVCYLLFQAKILGGGDAKLIAATAVWTGLAAFGVFALWTALAGGALALLLLIARWRLKPAETRPAFVNRLLKVRGGVPYGVAIMAGGLMALQASPLADLALTIP